MGFSALLAKRARADAVEVHAYGGYLLDQFQSELWNKRTDEYGGSLENRMRFTMEIIEEIKNTCGENFPIIVKFTPEHGVSGGRTLDEGLKMAKMFEEAGVTALHVDMGCYEAWYLAISTVYSPEACQIYLSEAVKKVVNIPIIAHGKLQNPVTAEKVLTDENADYIGLGHQLLADPYWANKVKEGNYREIVPCIGCNECMYGGRLGRYRDCAVNPDCYHELDYPVYPAKDKKSVLTIGGGPGGMEAAITASRRGHIVELWEKTDKLGGNLIPAGAPSFKVDVNKLIDYLSYKTYQSGVNVRLCHEATAEKVLKGNFKAVILATGSNPFIPNIPGIDGQNVITSTVALTNEKPITGKVAVIGGGLVGCETALHIAETADEVTIIEVLDDILLTVQHNLNNDQNLRDLIKDSKVKVLCESKVISISEDSIDYTKDGNTNTIQCETVIIASGYRENNELETALQDEVEFFRSIGDSVFPRKILNAVHEGFHAARKL
jgi:2-enoate reductase